MQQAVLTLKPSSAKSLNEFSLVDVTHHQVIDLPRIVEKTVAGRYSGKQMGVRRVCPHMVRF